MGRALLCTGEYAKIPYCFDNLGIRVFSAEELCYVLKEHAFLLDREIVDKKLVRWIDEELKLPELASALYPLLHQQTSVRAFVSIILEYVQFYDWETIRGVEDIYRMGANLNAYEKLKNRVDHMTETGRYAAAISEYDLLLEQLPEEEVELTAKILNNKAVALCGLFLFEEAAEEFLKAYEVSGDGEMFMQHLAAKRLVLSEEDYIAYAANYPDFYVESIELEKQIENLTTEWENSETKRRLEESFARKNMGEVAKYYEETDKTVQMLKNRYRMHVGS